MSTSKHIDKICIAVLIFTLILTVLFMNGERLGITALSDGEDDSAMFSENDLSGEFDRKNATEITLTENGAAIDGSGAYAIQQSIHITGGGNFILSGQTGNGSVTVDTDKKSTVRILLDGVDISCNNGAALRIEQAKKVFLTLAENTENVFRTGDASDDETVDGAIYARDDLTVNGAGTLKVSSDFRHGIVCNDDLVIVGGTLSITAKQDGIHANDSVRICDAAIEIHAGDDGITASNDDDTAYIYVKSGNISIPECYEGIEAITVTVAGGTLDITPTDDGINANGNGENSLIRIDGGSITIENRTGRDADGLDSNGDIQINGGKLFVSVTGSGTNNAIDYGSENGGTCVINGGTVIACGSSSMMESVSEKSAQGFIVKTGDSFEEKSELALTDAENNKILCETIPCSFNAAILSSPDILIGETYTLTVGEKSEEITVDNTEAQASGQPGMKPNSGGNVDDIPAPPDRNGTADAPPEPPDGADFGNGQPPEMPDGMPVGGGEVQLPPQTDNSSQAGTSAKELPQLPNNDESPSSGDSQSRKTDKENFTKNRNFQNRESFKKETDTLSADQIKALIFIGISAVILGIGLLIVYKKKI